MIAQAIIDASGSLLGDPVGVLSADALNTERADYDPDRERNAGEGFLDDAALPPDPAGACIIAVIDDAIPFAHERFRRADGTSRVAAFWAQDAVPGPSDGPGQDLPFGREWRGQGITGLLARLGGDLPDEDTLYRAAGILDFSRHSRPSVAYETGHGAAVANLAAGFAPDGPAGDNHPIIAVNLPPKVVEDSMGTTSPPYMLVAMLFIIHRARRLCRFIEMRRGLPVGSVRLPVVINISYGLSAGPRDGSTLFEQFMDAVSVASGVDLGPIRFVLPIGNHRQAMLVAEVKPSADLSSDEAIVWRIQPDDQTPSAIEIWGPPLATKPKRPFEVALAAPGQSPVSTSFTAEGQMQVLVDDQNKEVARAYYTPNRLPGTNGAPDKWRDGITIIAMPTCPESAGGPYAPPGDWRLWVAPGIRQGKYEISVQRDETIRGYHREARQSRLVDPEYGILLPNGRIRREDPATVAGIIRRRHTISAYCGGSEIIRAGAVEHAAGPDDNDDQPTERQRPSIYSGHLRNQENGDIQAVADRAYLVPGIPVQGRNSGAVYFAAGTSVAAPQVARWLAAEMAAGNRPANRDETVDLARQLAGAQPNSDAPILPFLAGLPEF